jgi:2-dehydro-3-deoxyphosphogluconate aldolase/(4S)-4-hydroxy-2-oxoglutarate aldolase
LTKNRSAVDDPEQKLRSKDPIAIVRLDDLSEAISVVQALLKGGIRTVEFALSNERALQAIGEVCDRLGSAALVGAGTVLDVENADAAIRAGARFLVTPVLCQTVIECGRERNVPVICGALSPTEIFEAYRNGVDLIKVFPARALGPRYISDLLAPLPQLKLVPTGGVNLENCAAFLAAGAYTVAIGSSLVGREIVARQDWQALTKLAQRYVAVCTEADASSEGN